MRPSNHQRSDCEKAFEMCRTNRSGLFAMLEFKCSFLHFGWSGHLPPPSRSTLPPPLPPPLTIPLLLLLLLHQQVCSPHSRVFFSDRLYRALIARRRDC